MLAESAGSGRVLGIGLHPFLVGQPWRAIHLARALDQLRSREGIWITTSDAVADWFFETGGVEA
jgi:allantoinase